MKINKFTLIVVAFSFVLILIFSGFFFGRIAGENTARLRFERANHLLLNLNAIGSYSTNAEISEQISSGEFDHAKCIADVTASAYFRQVRECLSQKTCRDLVYEEVKHSAPELLDDSKRKFTLYENLGKCTFAELNK